MIIRVLSDEQYEVAEEARAELRELDEHVEEAIAGGDAEAFHERYAVLLDVLRRVSTPLADDDLRTSDLILPPADVSFEEVQRDYADHGLIPD